MKASQFVSKTKCYTYVCFLDFDDDGTLDGGDLEKLVNCLTGETDETRLTQDEMRQLISNVSISLLMYGSTVDV